jgi:hypothetical protein
LDVVYQVYTFDVSIVYPKPFHVSIVYNCDAKIIPCWVCFPHSNIFVLVIGGEDWRG